LWLPWYIQFHWDAHFERFCTQQNWAMWAPTQGSLHTHLNTHCTSVSHACYTPHLGLFHFILTSDQQPFQGHFHKWTWSFPGNSATFSLLSCISQPLNLSKTELLFLLGSYFLFDWFFFFWDRVLLCISSYFGPCSPGWPWTCNHSASAFWVLGLQVCAIKPRSYSFLNHEQLTKFSKALVLTHFPTSFLVFTARFWIYYDVFEKHPQLYSYLTVTHYRASVLEAISGISILSFTHLLHRMLDLPLKWSSKRRRKLYFQATVGHTPYNLCVCG
jgi:hypothetical protein